MNFLKLLKPILICILLIALLKSSYAVEFEECGGVEGVTDRVCLNNVFHEKVSNADYGKIHVWLNSSREHKTIYGNFLSILICGKERLLSPPYGINKPFPVKDRHEVMKVAGHLIDRGAWLDYMAAESIVTVLFCLSNRKDSPVLNYILTRSKTAPKDLNYSHYEGADTDFVPLYRAILNNDLASARVLVQHGASPNFTLDFDTTTPLKTALAEENIEIANWLLDVGASVHSKGGIHSCEGKAKSALGLAKEIPKNIEGRDQLVLRIEKLLRYTPDLNICQGFKTDSYSN